MRKSNSGKNSGDKGAPSGLTEEAVKKRLVLFSILLVVSGIGFLTALHLKHPDQYSPVNPGDLSAKHALAAGENCQLCHTAHEEGFPGLARQVVAAQDMSGNCLECHQFETFPMKAHNQMFLERDDLEDVSCRQCHTEHKGRTANISAMSDAQCHACHLVKFDSFSKDHPDFSPTYPHADPTPIKFNHASHFEKHFMQENVKANAPLSCADCHTGESMSGKMMKTAGFEQTCAACHLTDIKDRDLLLFRLPEFRKNRLSAQEIRRAGGKIAKGKGGKEFESVSFETPSAIVAYLLNIKDDSPDEYEMGVQKLLLAMAKDGVGALQTMVKNKTGSNPPDSLLAGLNPDVVKMAAKAWISNKEFYSSDAPTMGGWHGDLLELRYKPIEHVDPVVKAWVEFAFKATQDAESDEGRRLASAMLEGLTSEKNGAGTCFSCHSLPAQDVNFEGPSRFVWKHIEGEVKSLHIFKHDIHTKFLGGDDSCEVCHELDLTAEYGRKQGESGEISYTANFKGIRKDLCASCHSANSQGAGKKISENCLMCHSYHQGHIAVEPDKFHLAPQKESEKL